MHQIISNFLTCIPYFYCFCWLSLIPAEIFILSPLLICLWKVKNPRMGYTRKLAEICFHYQTLDQLWTSEQIWLKNIMGERNSSHIFFYFKWYKKLFFCTKDLKKHQEVTKATKLNIIILFIDAFFTDINIVLILQISVNF